MRYGITSMADKGCFYSILDDAMLDYGIGVKKLEELLIDNGVSDISYKRLSDYRNGNHTPSFEKAKSILQVLNRPLSDPELMEALRLNKEKIKNDKDDLYSASEYKDLKITAMIKLRKLVPGKTALETEKYLWERIRDLYGDEKKISAYVQGLISKDLREGLISKEEVRKNEQD